MTGFLCGGLRAELCVHGVVLRQREKELLAAALRRVDVEGNIGCAFATRERVCVSHSYIQT